MEQEQSYQEAHETSPYAILFIFMACTIGGKLQVLVFLRGNVITKLVYCFDSQAGAYRFLGISFSAIVRQLMKGWPIPYTVVLIVLGLCFGAISGAVPALQK